MDSHPHSLAPPWRCGVLGGGGNGEQAVGRHGRDHGRGDGCCVVAVTVASVMVVDAFVPKLRSRGKRDVCSCAWLSTLPSPSSHASTSTRIVAPLVCAHCWNQIQTASEHRVKGISHCVELQAAKLEAMQQGGANTVRSRLTGVLVMASGVLMMASSVIRAPCAYPLLLSACE